MKARLFSIVIVLSLLAAAVGLVTPVQAAAYGTSFVTSITYQNIDTAPTTSIIINFYPENTGIPIQIQRPNLDPNAGTSVYVGGLSDLGTSFKGSAVLMSDKKLAATLVQIAPSGSPVKNRPLSNGFSVGSDYVLVPSVLKNAFNETSIVTVQNVDTDPADITLTFVPVGGGSNIHSTIDNLPSGAAKYVDLGTWGDITVSSFNGSLKINSVKHGTSTPGSVVATSLEASITTNDVLAFEGATTSAPTIYMPSAQCKFGPGSSTNTAYGVQNTSDGDVQVTVNYSNGHVDGPYTLGPGAKRSFDGCGASNPAGFNGSATISATGGNIVAVGKLYGGGLSTAFLGFTSGAEKIALPYVRWTEAHWTDGTRQRAYIAIQNVGASDLAAGQVTVKYYDKNGNLVGTDTLGAIPIGAKVNSNAGKLGTVGYEFGAYSDGSFGGSAIVQGPSGSQLAVVVRINTYATSTTMYGEDYTGIPIQ